MNLDSNTIKINDVHELDNLIGKTIYQVQSNDLNVDVIPIEVSEIKYRPELKIVGRFNNSSKDLYLKVYIHFDKRLITRDSSFYLNRIDALKSAYIISSNIARHWMKNAKESFEKYYNTINQ